MSFDNKYIACRIPTVFFFPEIAVENGIKLLKKFLSASLTDV